MKIIILLILVLALGPSTDVVKADFVFGTPTNLGPTINTRVQEAGPCISPDGLELYLYSFLSLYGTPTLRVATRETTEDPWGEAVKFQQPLIFSSSPDFSADGLSLYFDAERTGGSGGSDICVVTRKSTSDPWPNPHNLGASVNSSALEMGPSVSADGLELYFGSNRPGGSGGWDIYIATRTTLSSTWGTAENLEPMVNSASYDGHPCISPDGLTLFFTSDRPGGQGSWDIWVTKLPVRSF